jgi:KUP system potassium uptake protein
MESPQVLDGLRHACCDPNLLGIDPEQITYYFRRVMVAPAATFQECRLGAKALFATMHLNANLPATYFGVPAAQVGEVGMEIEI